MKKDCIGNDIRILSHQIHRWIENSPNKKKIDSVTGANAWIIGYISDKTKNNEDVFQKDLEKNFEITRSTASKVVNLMVEKGMVERQSVPSVSYTHLDHIGARAIGGYAPKLNKDNTIVYYVLNAYRPWSNDIDHIDGTLGQILGVSHIQLGKLHMVNNPNNGITLSLIHIFPQNSVRWVLPYY